MNTTPLEAIEARMTSGAPFTYSELCVISKVAGGNENLDRLADKTIQRWRRGGKIYICGRRGRSPLWRLTEPT